MFCIPLIYIFPWRCKAAASSSYSCFGYRDQSRMSGRLGWKRFQLLFFFALWRRCFTMARSTGPVWEEGCESSCNWRRHRKRELFNNYLLYLLIIILSWILVGWAQNLRWYHFEHMNNNEWPVSALWSLEAPNPYAINLNPNPNLTLQASTYKPQP